MMQEKKHSLVVYTKPACFGCGKTIQKLQEGGIEPHVVDLTQTPAALEYVTEELGYASAPVVVVDDDNHWSGLNPARIEQTIAALKTQ